MTSEERSWVKGLTGPLCHGDLERLLQVIFAGDLIVELFAYGMFDGLGMNLYDHAPTHLVAILEKQLPKPDEERPPKRPGCVHDHHWDFFKGLAERPSNLVWLRTHGLNSVKERSHYEY